MNIQWLVWWIYSFIDSFIQAISIASFQLRYYSEALPTQHGYCVRVSRRSATGNYELRTCPPKARMGFEPTTLRSKGFDSTNAPPHLYYTTRSDTKETNELDKRPGKMEVD